MFAPPHAHPQLQAVDAIEPTDPLAVDEPTLTPEQHPNPLIAKPRSGMREIPYPQPQCRLILGPTFSIPRGPAELG